MLCARKRPQDFQGGKELGSHNHTGKVTTGAAPLRLGILASAGEAEADGGSGRTCRASEVGADV